MIVLAKVFSALITITTFVFVYGCAQRSVPAPVINIDTQVTSKTSWQKAKTHTVTQSETLYGIAWLYGLDYQELAKLNALEEPYTIQAGQILDLRQKTNKEPIVIADTKVSGDVPQKTKPIKGIDKNTKKVYSDVQVSKEIATTKSTLPKRVTQWQWPAEGRLTGKFSNTEAGLKGIEIANIIGTPVVSAAYGKVVYTGSALRGYGNLVIIKHTDNFLSAYAHNNKILVKERQFVQAGEKIAELGRSGTTEAKLRFEIRYKGKSLDPLKYLPTLK